MKQGQLLDNFIGFLHHVLESQEDESSDELKEARMKFEAGTMLSNSFKRIDVPTRSEWIGVGLLERDDELKRKVR